MRYTTMLLGLVCALALWVGDTARSADTKSEFFNGKNLDGWEGLNEYWTVKDGAIVGTAEELKFNTFLCSKKKYKDFELKFQVRLKGGKGNSGVQVRSKISDEKHFAVSGPQADIGQEFWGSLWGEDFGGMMKQSDADAVSKVLKKDGFNDYSVKCVGKHCTIKINGLTTVDEDFDKMPEEGIIAWQLHGNMGPMEVTFKRIEFKELNSK
ncbi:MAG TPA: DUF1080 domain-containing protein [Gemmataceae bacterium]|jgi:hypothetical protein|nr:DUF1080 domain-containing protein [Gemmataceae bacterium]